jgi:EAL domain-containing protein (putative c-di-GMP-specific phosphodiesterase class I)
MDDFGAGYSNLSYLRTFPFSKIKIDRSFVADLEHNMDALAIIEATIGLSKKLGMCTTAEGVDRRAARHPRRRGMYRDSGYWVSPAVPADRVPPLIGRYGIGARTRLRAVS